MTMTPVLLADWLADAGLRNMPLEQMVDGFSRRLNETGVAVARIFVGTNTLHPMVRARSMIWDRLTGPGTHFEFNHAEIDAPAVQQSPFARMIRHGIAEQRYDLSTPAPEREIPVFEELRGAGMAEWLGRVFPFGELSPQIGGPAEAERADQLWLVCSVTTDRPGGYSESDLTVLRQLLPVFAWRRRPRPCVRSGRGCWPPISAATRRPASSPAPCTGAKCRASAVLFYADLRGFTGFADTCPARR